MRYAILGNSGSGKSTLAGGIGARLGVAPIDLDGIYWEPDHPGKRRDPITARDDLLRRLQGQPSWVVEGCYEDLIEAVLPLEPTLILLDPGEDTCLARCRQRPWEPHKYASKSLQDRNLAMLLDWVSDYYQREGPMSRRAHLQLFNAYRGSKEWRTD